MDNGTEHGNLQRRIIKAVGLFGSVESLVILFGMIRTKVVAVLLGTTGVGLFGIFFSAIELVSVSTQLSVGDSAVRNLASSKDPVSRGRTIQSISRWVWTLGFLGMAVMLLLAPVFSWFTFGNLSMTISYVILAVAVLLNSVSNEYIAILRGTESFRRLAMSRVAGSGFGLLLGLPLLYLFRQDSIIPIFIVITFLCVNIAGKLYSRNILREYALPPEHKEPLLKTLREGSSFIRLGAYMTVSAFATLASSYIFMAWLNEYGGTGSVGEFNAGFTVINKYVGVIFAAIGVEYYPRLIRAAANPAETVKAVNTEISVGLKLLTPCLCLLAALSMYVVTIFYSDEFISAVPFINLAIIGTVLRLFSWCYAYLILAKGDGRIYVVTEVVSAIVYIVSNILCYKWLGLTGLGISYIIWFLLYTVSVTTVYRCRYHLGFMGESWGNLLLSLIIVVSAVTATMNGMWWLALIIGVIYALFVIPVILKSFRGNSR